MRCCCCAHSGNTIFNAIWHLKSDVCHPPARNAQHHPPSNSITRSFSVLQRHSAAQASWDGKITFVTVFCCNADFEWIWRKFDSSTSMSFAFESRIHCNRYLLLEYYLYISFIFVDCLLATVWRMRCCHRFVQVWSPLFIYIRMYVWIFLYTWLVVSAYNLLTYAWASPLWENRYWVAQSVLQIKTTNKN